MNVALKRGRDVFLRDVPLRPPSVGEIRLAVTACGICGTDLHVREGDEEETGFGHEIAGTILELGPGVQGLEVGQRVVLESASACGHCANCRNCRQELCTDIRSFFHLGCMGFAEEVLAPEI